MNALTVGIVACMAVLAAAKPSGHGVVIKGPSGIVTGHGAWGAGGWGGDGGWDGGHGDWDDGSWHGDGGWDGGHGGWDGGWDGGHGDGGWDDGHWDGGHYSNVVHGNGATLVGAVAGHGGDGGWGGWGDHGGHGVVVKGPPTAPAVIIGPGKTGKVVADGLWGPTHKGLHGHGHW